VLDDSDLIKSESKKMEGLSLVPDGSNEHKRGLGYKLLNVVAVNSNDDGTANVIPMISDLYSNEIEMDSSKNIIFDQINEIRHPPDFIIFGVVKSFILCEIMIVVKVNHCKGLSTIRKVLDKVPSSI